MPVFALDEHVPQIDPAAFIAPTATLVGDVVIEAGASVWYNAVIRGDFSRITVRRGANVQDGSVLHGGRQNETIIGENVTIGHGCVVHGAKVGDGALVANGTTVLDGSDIGANALVGANSLLGPGTVVPEWALCLGSPAKVVKDDIRGSAAGELVERNGPTYQKLAERHAKGIRRVDG
ncbi:MAG: gamma carbonic anhydrase family protein [Dehalococcoidia bacterium]